MAKHYDQAYFDRWYRDPKHTQWRTPDVARKVRMVLGLAEYLLDRNVRSVLDVGCGEGTWQPILKKLRPRATYLGIDGSDYAVERFGRSRNIIKGSVGNLDALGIRRRFDLVVCCDVLHYVPTPEVRRALLSISGFTRGPAFLEAYTSSDDVSGDHDSFQQRSPAAYRTLFREAGFTQAGPHMYVVPDMARSLVELEKPQRP
jgi:SAM-dependent methyltransferase